MRTSSKLPFSSTKVATFFIISKKIDKNLHFFDCKVLQLNLKEVLSICTWSIKCVFAQRVISVAIFDAESSSDNSDKWWKNFHFFSKITTFVVKIGIHIWGL